MRRYFVRSDVAEDRRHGATDLAGESAHGSLSRDGISGVEVGEAGAPPSDPI